MYPVDSKIGPYDNGTTLYAYTEQSVAAKNIAYPTITLTFKYSLILFGYSFSALFFSRI